MTTQAHVDLWIAKGATADDARMLAAMYGAPKKADKFLDRWNIHASDWANVKCKANVKKIVKACEASNRTIERIYISPAFGSVYIEAVNGDDTDTIRISSHERTSAEHARPVYNVIDAASLAEAIKALRG